MWCQPSSLCNHRTSPRSQEASGSTSVADGMPGMTTGPTQGLRSACSNQGLHGHALMRTELAHSLTQAAAAGCAISSFAAHCLRCERLFPEVSPSANPYACQLCTATDSGGPCLVRQQVGHRVLQVQDERPHLGPQDDLQSRPLLQHVGQLAAQLGGLLVLRLLLGAAGQLTPGTRGQQPRLIKCSW